MLAQALLLVGRGPALFSRRRRQATTAVDNRGNLTGRNRRTPAGPASWAASPIAAHHGFRHGLRAMHYHLRRAWKKTSSGPASLRPGQLRPGQAARPSSGLPQAAWTPGTPAGRAAGVGPGGSVFVWVWEKGREPTAQARRAEPAPSPAATGLDDEVAGGIGHAPARKERPRRLVARLRVVRRGPSARATRADGGGQVPPPAGDPDHPGPPHRPGPRALHVLRGPGGEAPAQHGRATARPSPARPAVHRGQQRDFGLRAVPAETRPRPARHKRSPAAACLGRNAWSAASGGEHPWFELRRVGHHQDPAGIGK